MLELKLLRPFDKSDWEEVEGEEVDRLKDRWEFNSDTEWTIYQAKVFYEGFRDVKKAIEILEKGLEKDTQNSDILFCLAECYSRTPQSEKALEYCTKGLEINSTSEYGYTIKARVEIDRKNFVEAYTSAMNALKINKYNYEAGICLGLSGFLLSARAGRIDAMEKDIENLKVTLHFFPESKKVQNLIGQAESYLNKLKQGEKLEQIVINL